MDIPAPANPVPDQPAPPAAPPAPPTAPNPLPIPPTPPPSPPLAAPPPTPPAAIPYSSPSNNNKAPIIIGAGLLVLFIIAAIVFGSKYLGSNKKSSGLSPNSGKQTNAVPSKYAADADADGVPDTIESALGLNSSVSEFTRCQPVLCGSSAASPAQTKTNNILLIIDSSGSMGLTIGGKTKMDLAKEAIRGFLQSTAADVNIGIMVYGHKGSNSASQKAASCAGADVIASIGSVNPGTVDSYLAQIQPVGWTPIGLAIKKGKDAFTGKEGQKNQMIIVTDGAETCDTNPAGAAAEVKSSPYQVRVDVIGFAVNTAEQSSLQAISTNGGGLFSVAMNADQLLSQIRASHENFESFVASGKCTADVYQKSITCLQDTQKKVFDYLSSEMSGKKGAEYSELITLQSRLSSQYSSKINTLQDEWSAANKGNLQQLNK